MFGWLKSGTVTQWLGGLSVLATAVATGTWWQDLVSVDTVALVNGVSACFVGAVNLFIGKFQKPIAIATPIVATKTIIK